MITFITRTLHVIGYAATAAVVMAITFYLVSDDLQAAMLASACAAVAGGFLGYSRMR